MVRKSTLVVSILASALAVPAIGGCTVHAAGGAQAGGQNAPPPPPPAPNTPPPETPAEPPPEQPQTSTATMSGGKVSIPGNIVFDTGKASLKEGAGSEKVLEQLKLFLDENPQVSLLRIEGHTDNVGKPEDNIQLSGQRALTIKKWLIDKGTTPERLIAVGFW